MRYGWGSFIYKAMGFVLMDVGAYSLAGLDGLLIVTGAILFATSIMMDLRSDVEAR